MYSIQDVLEFIEFKSTTRFIIITLGFFCVLASTLSRAPRIESNNGWKWLAIVLAIVLIWRIGYLPVGFGFTVDRENYAYNFLTIKYSGSTVSDTLAKEGHDWLLGTIMLVISKFGDYKTFFIIIAALYIGLYFITCNRLVRRNVFWLFAACALSMAFISYGVNTIRAGLAVSILLLGLSFNGTLWKMLLCFFLALSTHFSMIIPITMILISRYFDRTKLFFYLWLISIPISAVAGQFFNTFFSTFIDDQRTDYLTSTENTIYNVGFRIDFILYSLAPLIVGYYYIFKRNFHDAFYKNLYNAYILTNLFWILVIRANFSDRFAYLSWFMIPFVLFYPLLKQPNLVRNPTNWLSIIYLGETVFKFFFF